MNKFDLLSRLSRGYGTWDGIAKKEPVESENEFFPLDELRLPPIIQTYDNTDKSKVNYTKTYQAEPLKLPTVRPPQSTQPLSKTYTTRKGALLLYTENYFLPGSPKAKKRRRKLKQQSALKLKTLSDLRDFILNYKRNGGDPLFLALLQKRLSNSSYGNHVRPGFSPKRYIATLGRSLQEDSWNKLLTSGSFKDPALQSYNPYGPSIHNDGSVCELFPNKPQPYSTMSLPPISPSSSMLGSAFNFYPNGMSTGAASMISLNSEEYAPSSRAISPVESLNERLSEVEPIRAKKDYRYSMLGSKQKEEILSQMLVQKTLETVDSDLQTWPVNFKKEDTYDSNSSLTGAGKRKSSKGSLKSSSLTSIPRLPPIQSAGARPSSPFEIDNQENRDIGSSKSRSESRAQQPVEVGSLASQSHNSFAAQSIQSNDQSKSSSIHQGEVGSLARSSRHSSAVDEKGEVTDDAVDPSNVEINLSDESSHWGEALSHVIDNIDVADGSQDDEEENMLSLVKSFHEQSPDDKENLNAPIEIDKTSEDSIDLKDFRAATRLEDKIPVAEDQVESKNDVNEGQLKEKEESQSDREETNNEVLSTSHEPQLEQEDYVGPDDFEKSIGGTSHSRSTTSLSITEDHGPSPEPPPPITFEQLQNEARVVASRVLNRPQSGAVFMEDARAALAMWADRLSTLLDPPSKDARTSSAAMGRKPNFNQNMNGTGFVPNGRKRKVSQSAGPSLAALRQALLISGGQIPEIESLKNLPPIRLPNGAPPSKHSSAVSQRHSGNEPLKDGDLARSSRASGSTGLARSILTERLSNSDLQMDMLNLVSNEELGFVQDRAQTAQDDESEDEEFRAALQAVITDLQGNVSTDQIHKVVHKVSTPPKEVVKKKTPPFQVKRPDIEKPPPGLQPQKTGDTKPKGKDTKKGGISKNVKKTAPKKGGKAAKKTDKIKAEKPEKSNKPEKAPDKKTEPQNTEPKKTEAKESDLKTSVNDLIEPSDLVNDVSPDTSIRVASESSKRLDDFSETPTRDSESGTESAKRSESGVEQQQLSTNSKSPSVQSVHSAASVIEQPRLVPKPPEPEPEPEIDHEQERRDKERLDAELSRKKEKEARAAKRAEERAAAAERRRQEVERKRREKEEAKRKQLEEEARLEKVRQDAEEEMKRREMEMRKKREEKEAEKQRKEEEELRKEREERARIEREKRQREEFERKKQELLARRKLEEEIRREQEKLEAEIEEANRRAEEERLLEMEESERIALQERMRREEEEMRKRLEAERIIQEEKRRVQEEQRRMREEAIAALRQKRLQRQLFITSLIREGVYMSLSQRLSRAFTFTYFDKLPWSFLNNLRTVSPIKDLIHELKEKIPPTIYEIEEEEETT